MICTEHSLDAMILRTESLFFCKYLFRDPSSQLRRLGLGGDGSSGDMKSRIITDSPAAETLASLPSFISFTCQSSSFYQVLLASPKLNLMLTLQLCASRGRKSSGLTVQLQHSLLFYMNRQISLVRSPKNPTVYTAVAPRMQNMYKSPI